VGTPRAARALARRTSGPPFRAIVRGE
jgi:hypothetical protein